MEEDKSPQINSVLQIDIKDIVANKNQPRKEFSEKELMELAHSIYHNGILQPISVRLTDDNMYEIIAGERRYRASIIAGLKSVPCIVINADDKKAALFSLIENIQRHDLGFFEEAAGIQRLINDYGLSQEEAAQKIGKAQSTLSNKLRLLKLPSYVRNEAVKYGLTERHARALLKIQDEEKQRLALKIIIEKKLNVAQTESLIERILNGPKEDHKNKVIRLFKDVRIFVNTLNHAVSTMRSSGINADSTKTETDDYIEYLVRIPKKQYGRITNSKKSAV